MLRLPASSLYKGLQFIISHRAVWYKVGNNAELAADISTKV